MGLVVWMTGLKRILTADQHMPEWVAGSTSKARQERGHGERQEASTHLSPSVGAEGAGNTWRQGSPGASGSHMAP